uniref:Uncharacterized protein n=1 Tax=Tanacetum cinerariifolium TaxID=118510 RepID=A0A6L2NTM3_TANCI|nr:hypothetical protein [Tanacetum cinerariifolium]
MMTPYVLVRQAYTPIATDTEFEPFEETQPVSPRVAPLSHDYTLASPDYTPDTPYSDEESKPTEASETRTASPSDSTSSLSPDYPLTHTSPTLHLLELFTTTGLHRYIPSCETPTPSSSPQVASPALTPRKRYQSTSELIANIDTKSEDSEDERYGVPRRRPLKLAEDTSRNTFEVGQSFRSVPDPQIADPTRRLLVRLTWVDPKDDTVYLDINFDPPARAPVQTLASPEWSFGSLPILPTSLTVPSPIPLPVTTPIATILVDEDAFLERFRLRSLEHGHERATITFGAFWQLVLALEAWARQSDAQRTNMWQARYEDHRLIYDFLVQNTATQHELQELRDRVTALEQERSRRREYIG